MMMIDDDNWCCGNDIGGGGGVDGHSAVGNVVGQHRVAHAKSSSGINT